MLAVMAYDCYVAICNPLLYNVIMSYYRCFQLTVTVYILCIIESAIHTGFMLRLYFCKANVINHYFCDLFPLLELSCSSVYVNELLVLVLSAFNTLTPDLTILTCYLFVLSSILQITPLRAGPKPSAPAALTSQLLLFSMDLKHLCTCSHHLWAPWTKGKCPLCFIPALCPCWILGPTVCGIRMSNWPWRKFWTVENVDE